MFRYNNKEIKTHKYIILMWEDHKFHSKLNSEKK